MTPRLALEHITKVYPSVVANDNISFEVMPGEVLAVLGENGAGKSTLMKIIFGSTQADEGTLSYDGKPVHIDSPIEAKKLGISMVHQHFAVFETLTVEQNVLLGLPAGFDASNLSKKIIELGEHYGIPVDPKADVMNLSMGERQRVEIIRALMTKPSLLILDEPTSVLTPQAVQKLFETLKKLSAEGVSILFISHKLDEIRELANRCVVLRSGKLVATVDPKTESEESLARLMIGHEPPKLLTEEGTPGRVLFEVKQLSFPSHAHLCGVDNVSLTVRANEIVGIAGISGNGQSRFFGVCAGELPASSGQVLVDGQDITNMRPEERRRLGLRYVPEQRLGHGAVPDLSLKSNTLLTGDKFQGSFGVVVLRVLSLFSKKIVNLFHVATPTIEKPAAALSGGNLQKFIVGREVLSRPQVLLIDQPTWGVDVGAATVIHNSLIRLRSEGAAVVVVSEEIDELFAICDRIAVMYRGSLSPAVDKKSLNIETIGRWMSGLWPGSPYSKSNKTGVA